jgi:diguanylate cyclase (GGDEF)-like protein
VATPPAQPERPDVTTLVRSIAAALGPAPGDAGAALDELAAIAVESAQERAEAQRHQVALESLLAVSSRLLAEAGPDAILREVCCAVRDALGFRNVRASLLDAGTGRLVVRAAVGRSVDRAEPVDARELSALLDPVFEREGCYLLPDQEPCRRNRLLVPLHDESGCVIGAVRADEPDDRRPPSAQRLQALRVFANQAAAAVLASQYVAQLRFLADHDPLTRLLNRRAFVERLDGEVARALRYGRRFALVVCDLDGFKELNDRFGHPAGDEALQRFARSLEAALRRGDSAFRIGGDEFALLLAEASEADAREVLRRVTLRLDGLRASFGVASCPDHATDAQSLLRLADGALYAAKRSGGGLQFVA